MPDLEATIAMWRRWPEDRRSIARPVPAPSDADYGVTTVQSLLPGGATALPVGFTGR
jgi:hypothetical protein